MKKVLLLCGVAAFAASTMMSCGPSKEELEAREKARQDSIAAVEALEKARLDSIAAAEARAKFVQDSIAQAVAQAQQDSIAKAEEEAAKKKGGKKSAPKKEETKGKLDVKGSGEQKQGGGKLKVK